MPYLFFGVKMNCLLKTLLFLALFGIVLGGLGDLVVAILSQKNQFHSSRTEAKIQNWKTEFRSTTKTPVFLASYEIETEGVDWTVVPLFTKLAEFNDASWFLFITEDTIVNFTALDQLLSMFDPSLELFLGHALTDTQHTIIHHFAPPGSMSYPLLTAGFLLTRPAIQRAAEHVEHFNISFNIDPMYELAVYLKYHHTPSLRAMVQAPPPAPPTALLLTHLPQLCHASPSPDGSTCATVCGQDVLVCSDRPEVTTEQVHFAVKTCAKYHSSRLPIVWKTWGPHVQGSIAYYSEVEDTEYSTVDTGVPNTEKGHCGKAMAIANKFYADSASRHGLKWLVIADDDTLLSAHRLLRLLRCYDHTHPILLGEVYGYEAQMSRGYTYVTGGGGMVLSQGAVASLVDSNHKCPSHDYPDDMFFGSMAKVLQWDVVHSALFHQSQPPSFHKTVLDSQVPISFHRHNPMDPETVYSTYLQDHTHKDRTEL